MAKKKSSHIHKYKRYTYKSTGHQIYRCALAGCTHFINAILLVGRECICWRCDNSFIVKNANLAKPHCESCTQTSNAKKKESKSIGVDVDKLTELLTG